MEKNVQGCEQFRSDYSKQLPRQFIRICVKIEKRCQSVLENVFNVKMHVFFVFFISRLTMHARCVNWAGYRCEVRTIWGHPQQFESTGICVTSLAQESEVRVPLGFRVMVKNLSHRFCLDWATMSWTGRPCQGIFWLIFETFLGGTLRHNVYRGYIVFWGTIIYCSLACSQNQLFFLSL